MPSLRTAVIAVVDYLLGFIALIVFAGIAFAPGIATDQRFIWAFKVGALVAAAELIFLLLRPRPPNRLIIGANLWLLAGGVAALTEQWWWLQGYQRLGESSLFLSMLLVGVASTVLSSAGFVAAYGNRRAVLLASGVLLLAVLLALAASIHFRGTVHWAAVVPVIALSWLNRVLRLAVNRGSGATTQGVHGS